jgi:hypothetical protein
MATPTQTAVARVKALLGGEQGLALSMATLRSGNEELETVVRPEQLGTLQSPAEFVERSGKAAYPSFQVYVEKIRNKMTEKFRRFSGTVHVVTEIRISQDRLEGLTEKLQFYTDAVTDVLERNRGCLGEGMYLSGAYEVSFEPVKKGGLHYQQAARVSSEIDVNRA